MTAISTGASAEVGKGVLKECHAAELSSMKCKVYLYMSVRSHLEVACCLGVRTALVVASLAGVDRLQIAWGEV